MPHSSPETACLSPLLASWLANRPDPAWAQAEGDVERRVSAVIGAMPFTWLPVPDHPDPIRSRGWVERHAIALLTGADGPRDRASPAWLGRWAPRAEVRESGLWNVQHVGDPYDPRVLDVVASMVADQ